MRRLFPLHFLLACLATQGSVAVAAAATPPDFASEIEPLFQEHCFECHGPDQQKSEFRLDRLAILLRGGDSGEPAILPGNPDDSHLIKLVSGKDPDLHMPPKSGGRRALSEEEIQLLSRWIAAGATTPESYGPAEERPELTHWSLLPVVRPGSAHSIDGFIRNQLAGQRLQPSGEADRHKLIRRLYLVMLGLPPAPEKVRQFVNDSHPNAWPLLVEEVLASPRYGERWATHWLDIVRFGETHGFETNRERPHAWRFRDWVIAALNEDKPYDEFVRGQIAGDAYGEPSGTGFLVAGPFDQVKGKDPKLRLMQRMNELDDMINATGTAFLGLTLGCARCHNHKFDPVTQKDYYSMQAIFAGVQHGDRPLPLPAERREKIAALEAEISRLTKQLKPFERVSTAPLREAVNARHNIEKLTPAKARFVRFTIEKSSGNQPCIDELEIFSGNENVALASRGARASSSGDFVHPKHKLAHINDGQYGNSRSWIAQDKTGWVQIELPEPKTIDRIEWARDREGKFSDRLALQYRIEAALEPGKWFTVASSLDRPPPSRKDAPASTYEFASHPPDKAEEGRRWLARLKQAQKERDNLDAPEMVYAGKFGQPGPTHRLYRGEPDAKREQVGPDAISALTSLDLDWDAPEQKRRRAFAEWIACRDNPLTARVMVNRIWQFHFGTGIVDTPNDFGANGSPPTHPELLDWLAAEFMDNGWSLKHMHRLILNSHTWRQDSRPRPEAMKIDAATRLLWRFPTRRLEAEGIRDAILAATGTIDLSAGGPGFSAFRIEKENVRHYHPKENYGPGDWRRMIYMTKVRQEKDAVFGVFDCPDASQVVPKRSRSTTPLQALNLLNSDFILQQAGLLAKRLERDAQSTPGQIRRAWELCFNRPPHPGEIDEAENFIANHGLEQFTRALLNASEFVFIP